MVKLIDADALKDELLIIGFKKNTLTIREIYNLINKQPVRVEKE